VVIRAVLAFALVLILSSGGCERNKSEGPTGPGYSELIVGSWEWVYVVESGEVDYMDEDVLFWVFTAEGNYCDPELDHNGEVYYVSCHGSYTITATLLTIDCPSGTHIEAEYELSQQGDTLRYGRIDVAQIVMKRADNPPDYGGCE